MFFTIETKSIIRLVTLVTRRWRQLDCKWYRFFSFFVYIRNTMRYRVQVFCGLRSKERSCASTAMHTRYFMDVAWLDEITRLCRRWSASAVSIPCERNRRFQRSILPLPREKFLPSRTNSFTKRVTRHRPSLHISIGMQTRYLLNLQFCSR